MLFEWLSMGGLLAIFYQFNEFARFKFVNIYIELRHEDKLRTSFGLPKRGHKLNQTVCNVDTLVHQFFLQYQGVKVLDQQCLALFILVHLLGLL
jgi:hypothetical protein